MFDSRFHRYHKVRARFRFVAEMLKLDTDDPGEALYEAVCEALTDLTSTKAESLVKRIIRENLYPEKFEDQNVDADGFEIVDGVADDDFG